MRFIFYYILFLLIPFTTFSQIVSGIVADSSNRPLSGVTVTLKGTKQATLTDLQGRFSIRIYSNRQILKFSATGYNPIEEVASTKGPMQITLRISVSSLDEVQVIAYGTVTQRLNVGSISKVKSDDIGNQPVSNPLAALQGRVPGLVITSTSGVPGAAFKVQVRGQNTLSSTVQGLGVALPIDNPLFIIDGVPFSPQNSNINQFSSIQSPTGAIFNNPYGGASPFNSINPSDIESIEVLRDADATAIYGSRGGNGVILITTKKGKGGKTNFTIDVSNGASVVGKTMPMMNTQQYIMMRKEAIKNDGLTPNLTLFDNAYAPDILYFDTTKYTDWKDYFLGNTAQNTVVNTSLSGGSQNTNFRIAAGFNRNTYIFPGEYADNRANFSVNLHHNSVNERLYIDFTSSSSYNKNNSSGSRDLLTAYRLEPNFPNLLDQNNKLLWSYNGIAFGLGIGDNPISYLRNTYYMKNIMLNNSLQFGYKIFDGLITKVNVGHNTMLSNEYFGNPFAAQNPLLSPEASASFGNNNFTTWIIEPQIEYKNTIKGGSLTILFGATLQRNINSKTQAIGTGYINDGLLESLNSAATRYVSDDFSDYKYAAIFGRINYVLDRKYILNINARRDGSSRFGPGKQFGNFGSIGAGWLFAENGFIKDNLTFLSYGKLRTSYGITGSDAIGDYQYLSRWGTTTYPYSNNIGYTPQNLYNPMLAWASTKKFEIGIELGFYKDRILFNSTWFRNRSGDQLLSYYLPSQTGFSSVTENWNAIVQNSGFEFTLQTQNIRGKDFHWSSSFNLSIPKNKLVSFPGLESSSYATTYVIDESLNSIYGFKYEGVNQETGLFQYKTANGQLSSTPKSPSGTNFNDFVRIGNRDPKFYGGLQNTFSYNGLQLDVFIEFKKQLGANYLNQVYAFTPGQEYNVPAALLKRWQSQGDITDIQRYSVSYSDAYESGRWFPFSSGAYSDASYLRLKTVNLSYNFKEKISKRLGLRNLRVYGVAQNLFTITNYLGNDPETQSLYGIPVLKTFVFGLQLSL